LVGLKGNLVDLKGNLGIIISESRKIIFILNLDN
jgi:hypothetical protein